jgi:hypothetical protein
VHPSSLPAYSPTGISYISSMCLLLLGDPGLGGLALPFIWVPGGDESFGEPADGLMSVVVVVVEVVADVMARSELGWGVVGVVELSSAATHNTERHTHIKTVNTCILNFWSVKKIITNTLFWIIMLCSLSKVHYDIYGAHMIFMQNNTKNVNLYI